MCPSIYYNITQGIHFPNPKHIIRELKKNHLLQGSGLGEAGRQADGIDQGALDHTQVLQRAAVGSADEDVLLSLLLLLQLRLRLLGRRVGWLRRDG